MAKVSNVGSLFDDVVADAPPVPVVATIAPTVVEVDAAPVVVDEGGQEFLGFVTADDVDAMRRDEIFLRVDESIETAYRCPCCGYEWSGNPKPNASEIEAVER